MRTAVPTASRRWWICGLLFCATALSFLDRQVLAAVAEEVSRYLGIKNLGYSFVNTAFLVSYAAMFLVGGRIMDLLGTRLGMAFSVGIWSIASGLHSLVQTAWQLASFRFLLGVGEGGCFPGAAKGVAESFEPRERALAMGIAIGGASLGSVIALPMGVWVSKWLGWRSVFIITGMLGAAWVIAWWLIARPAGSSTLREHAESNVIEEPRPTVVSLMRRADTWGFAIVRFIVDPVMYFYLFWIPKYLETERGTPKEVIGGLTWIPFLMLGISNIAGGWASDCLIRRGMPAFTARRLVMAAAAVVTVASSFTTFMYNLPLALTMMSLLMLAHGFWITNYVTLISERFPKNAVGTVMGFSGAIGAIGGMLANTGIGWCVDHFSYGPVWIASGVMYPLAFGVLLLTITARQPMPPTPAGFEPIMQSRGSQR